MDGLKQDTALVREIADFAKTTPAGVAHKIGVAKTTINRPFNGTATTRLSQRTIEKLRDAYPDFPGWSSSAHESRAPFNHNRPLLDLTTGDDRATDTVDVEQIDLRYGMGASYIDDHIEVERRAFSREWLRSITSAAPSTLAWAKGEGESMEPTIRSGEIILIDRSQDTPRFDDSIWAVTHGEIGMIKRLRQRPDGTVELHSDNHLVTPQTAVDGELHVVGRVVAVIRRL